MPAEIDLIACQPGDDIESVMYTMKRSQLRRIRVTDGTGQLRHTDKTADVLTACPRLAVTKPHPK
jgi:hypothetical protein